MTWRALLTPGRHSWYVALKAGKDLCVPFKPSVLSQKVPN